MARTLQIFAAATAFVGITGLALARGSDDDGKETVETRLLKILKDRGVLKDSEFDELVRLGAKMRAEESITTASLDRELRELSEKISQGTEAKKTDDMVKTTYKLGKGVTFAHADDFMLNITAFLQPKFAFIAPKKALTSTGQDDRATFNVQRAEFIFSGFLIDKNLTYKFVFDTATDSGKLLRDAFFDYKVADELHVRAGQMRTPFSRQNFTGSDNLEIVDRSATTEHFRSVVGDRDDGILLWGELGDEKTKIFEWYLGVFNGEGLNNGVPNQVKLGSNGGTLNTTNSSNDDSSGLDVQARFAFNPNGPVSYVEGDLDKSADAKYGFGLKFDHNPERRGNPLGIATGVGGIPTGQLPVYDVDTWGADFVLKYSGLFVQTEYFYREIAPAGNLHNMPTAFRTSTETGWYAQGGFFFGDEPGKGPEVAFRYSQIDWDQNIAPASVKGNDTKIDDYTAAFNYYWLGHSVKLQVAYTYRVESIRGHNPDGIDQILQVQAQVKF